MLVALLAAAAASSPVGIEQLLATPAAFDGRRVTVSGVFFDHVATVRDTFALCPAGVRPPSARCLGVGVAPHAPPPSGSHVQLTGAFRATCVKPGAVCLDSPKQIQAERVDAPGG